MKKFQDRVAVVTGAGGGLGLAISVELARRGVDLALVDVSEERLLETAAAVGTEGVDITDRARLRALVDEVLAEHGRVHMLFNNAGVAAFCPFVDQSLEDFDWVMNVNFMGAVAATKFFLPVLLEQEEGHIVNVASLAAMVGMPNQAAYSATKSALHAFSEALHGELDQTRVNVTSVLPGAVATGIAQRARGKEGRKRVIEGMIEKARDPAEVAAEVVRAVEREKFELVVCRDAKGVRLVSRLAPSAVRWAYAWAERNGRMGG
jgi:short-subunit dehydrogenase